MQYEEKFVLVDGKKIAYLDVGEGPVILFIHGSYCVKESFWGLMGYIPNYRLIALDLPGFGMSEYDSECLYLQYFASKVFRFTNEIGVKPLMMFGHSLGGSVTLELAGKDLIRPGTIVLHAPVITSKQMKPLYNNPLDKIILKMSLKSERLESICEKIVKWGLDREIQPLTPTKEHLELKDFVYNRSLNSNWIVFVKSLLNLMNCNYSTTLDKLVTPITILHPEHDRFLKEYYGSENFRVRKIEGHHAIMSSNWEDIAQEIQIVIDDIKRRLEVG